jgi:hypothetical protein
MDVLHIWKNNLLRIVILLHCYYKHGNWFSDKKYSLYYFFHFVVMMVFGLLELDLFVVVEYWLVLVLLLRMQQLLLLLDYEIKSAHDDGFDFIDDERVSDEGFIVSIEAPLATDVE